MTKSETLFDAKPTQKQQLPFSGKKLAMHLFEQVKNGDTGQVRLVLDNASPSDIDACLKFQEPGTKRTAVFVAAQTGATVILELLLASCSNAQHAQQLLKAECKAAKNQPQKKSVLKIAEENKHTATADFIRSRL